MTRATELSLWAVGLIGAMAIGWASGIIPAILGAVSFLIQAALVIAMLPIAIVCVLAVGHFWPHSSR